MAIIVQYLGCKIYFIFENVKMIGFVLVFFLGGSEASSIFIISVQPFLNERNCSGNYGEERERRIYTHRFFNEASGVAL